MSPNQTLKVGDKVLLKNKKKTFHRSNPLMHPHFSENTYTVVDIDKKYLPWTYTISHFPHKKFYFFELRRVTNLFGSVQTENNQNNKIYVQNFVYQNSDFLRSKKSYPHKQNLFYIIQRNEKTEQVTKEALIFFKKILGRNILEYSSIFDEPKNRHLKV